MRGRALRFAGSRENMSTRTIRRRVESPVLRWTPPGPDRQYRVAVRDEDTGRRLIIYEGFQTECRLPADLRLTPNQLSFWVGSRSEQEPTARFLRCQDYTVITRLGDDYQSAAPDRLTASERPNVDEYRLRVRDSETGRILVEMSRSYPAFLLPAGQLEEGIFEWTIQPRLKAGFGKPVWASVTDVMVSAARSRAERLIALPEEPRPALAVVRGELPPGSLARIREAPPQPATVALALPVTADPRIAPEPSLQSVITTQWINSAGTGAIQMASCTLKDAGVSAWFFLDIGSMNQAGSTVARDLTATLIGDGHQIGLTIGESVWDFRPQSEGSLTDFVSRQLDAFITLTGGGDVTPVRLSVTARTQEWLRACSEAGLSVVTMPRKTLRAGARWMHWRTAPFVTADGVVVLPPAMLLSTPAHPRDQVLRHPVNAADSLAAASAAQTLNALATTGKVRLLIAEADPLRLLARVRFKRRKEAEAWNGVLRHDLPEWWDAGWGRTAAGYDVAQGVNEIQVQMLSGLAGGMKNSDLSWGAATDVFDETKIRGWLDAEPSANLIVEQRRGPRLTRLSEGRAYDNALRLALLADHA